MKINKALATMTTIVVLLPVLLGVFFWQSIPEQVATRFDFSGHVVNTASKIVSIFGLPLILLALHIFLIVMVSREASIELMKPKLRTVIYWLVPLISFIMQTAFVLNAAGIIKNTAIFMPVFLALGLIFILIGNYLPKIRYNRRVGIKLPWTFASEENWDKTHRFTGKVWVFGGVISLFLGFLGQGGVWLILLLIAAMLLLPALYSFLIDLLKNKTPSVTHSRWGCWRARPHKADWR